MGKVFAAQVVSVDGYIAETDSRLSRGLPDATMVFDCQLTDEQIQEVTAGVKPYSVVLLWWGPKRNRQGADAIERAHQRRILGLHEDGVIAVLCPSAGSDTFAGVAVLKTTPDEAAQIMAGDPCVQADMIRFEIQPCVGFPGDVIPMDEPTSTGHGGGKAPSRLGPQVRRILDGAPIAHLASVGPDGAPHSTPVYIGTHEDKVVVFTGPGTRKAENLRRDPRVAISIAPGDDPTQPLVIRGRVISWIEGDPAWKVIDQIVAKYVDSCYPRDLERVVAVIEPEHQNIGVG